MKCGEEARGDVEKRAELRVRVKKSALGFVVLGGARVSMRRRRGRRWDPQGEAEGFSGG